jgi:hypothetical protein
VSRAGGALVSLLLLVLGGAIILQAFDYHQLFGRARVPGWVLGMAGLAFFTAGLCLLARLLDLGSEIVQMLGATVGLAMLAIPHYVAYLQGIAGWIVMALVDAIVLFAIVELVKRRKEKA